MSNSIYSIGHSSHDIESFISLLNLHSIDAVVDVRSSPYSRMYPHFNREPLRAFLRQSDIQYVFMGDCLGGRPDDPTCFKDGQAQYDRVAQLSTFKIGLERLHQGAEDFRIALMCSEKDPINCHRMLLVSRQLSLHKVDIQHILSGGEIESQQKAELRMMAAVGVPQNDLFESFPELLDKAYRLQSQKCAFAFRDEVTPIAVSEITP